MKRFFQRYPRSSITLVVDEILPQEGAASDSVYAPYLKALGPSEFDDELLPYRHRALAGALEDEDWNGMRRIILAAVRQARKGGFIASRGKETPTFYAYARVNTLAMLLAQILFVNNAVREGIVQVLDNDAAGEVIDRLAEFIAQRVPEEARFYANLFAFQVAFDKIFVPDEAIVTYNVETGDYQVTDRYEECTAYLELANKRVLLASDAEKELCFEITTGWSAGIDRETWDKLNEYYYGGVSPTTGQENLFVKNYDVMLERMLPQFAFSKVRLAEELVRRADGSLKILEIGAGSGAFAIDLIMACKRLGFPLEKVSYEGVEPSTYMLENFRENVTRKIGDTPLPEDWRLVEGSLETVHEAPDQYIGGDGETVVVFSFSLHHCYRESVQSFFRDAKVRDLAKETYVLEGCWEHGWTKVYYMWVDCEAPENFHNVLAKGDWDSETLWTEPSRPLEGHCVTLGWSCLRRLT